MLDIVLYVFIVIFATSAVLPVVVRFRVTRAEPKAPIVIDVDVSLWAGLVGFAAHGPTWVCNPTLFLRPIPLSIPLTRKSRDGPDVIHSQPVSETVEQPETPPETAPLLQKAAKLRFMWRLLANPSVGLLRSLPFALDLRRLSMRGRIGLDDPSKTGQLYGVLQCLRRGSVRGKTGRLEIHVEPDFVQTTCCGRMEMCVHLFLSHLVATALRFSFQITGRWLVTRVMTTLSVKKA